MRGGWFHTGDMAVIDEEGYFLIVDRKKDIIISGGENIASIEIEKAIFSHPSVLECAVIAVPDDRWGEVPKALVVLKPGATLTDQELIDHCRTKLPGFKIPKSVEFFDALPKGGTGKILKKELRERYWEGQEKRVH
jgi:acyl-CoA synthetase (AMP-forming)/AMP-acid ligase II